MNEVITQNPIISLIIILVPTVAVIWKVMEVLYIKPREFRINSLENHLNELRNEIEKIEKKTSLNETQSKAINITENEVSNPITKDIKEEKEKNVKVNFDENKLYQSLESLFNQWKNEDITKLQKTKIEESSIGKTVTWDVYVDSISKFGFNNERIMLSAKANIDDYLSSPNVAAVFDIKYEDSLLLLQKGDKITISGKITSFSLSPILEDCKLIKKIT